MLIIELNLAAHSRAVLLSSTSSPTTHFTQLGNFANSLGGLVGAYSAKQSYLFQCVSVCTYMHVFV